MSECFYCKHDPELTIEALSAVGDAQEAAESSLSKALAEIEKLQMRIDDTRSEAFVATNPSNIPYGMSDKDLVKRLTETLDKIAEDSPDDGSEDWIDRFFAKRDQTEKSLSKALARVAELEVEIPKHRERWQRLVNAVAGRFARGLVVGDDDMAVDLAIQRVKQAPDAADMRERAAKAVEELLITSKWSVGYVDFRSHHIDCRDTLVQAIRALPLTALQEPGDD